MSEPSIPSLDILDPSGGNVEVRDVGRYRRNYFLRRSIGTLREFTEGIRLLAECPEFAVMKASFNAELEQLWDSATGFFQSKEELIKKVRNDIGGHFGSHAAIYAIAHLSPNAVGKIEVRNDDLNLPRDPRLHFAGEIAASAFARHLPGSGVEEQLNGFIRDVLIEGWRHAVSCVQVLLALRLWPSFGR